MSRHINVNPGQYKVAGRERQGEDILQAQQKQAYATQQADGAGDEVPPWEATRHTFVSAQPEPEPEPTKKPRKAPKAKTAKKSSTTRKAVRPMAKKAKRATAGKPKRATRARGKMRAAKSSGSKKKARRSR